MSKDQKSKSQKGTKSKDNNPPITDFTIPMNKSQGSSRETRSASKTKEMIEGASRHTSFDWRNKEEYLSDIKKVVEEVVKKEITDFNTRVSEIETSIQNAHLKCNH